MGSLAAEGTSPMSPPIDIWTWLWRVWTFGNRYPVLLLAKPSKMFLKLQLVSALWGGRSNVSNFRAKLTSSKVGKVVANPLSSRPFFSLEFKRPSHDFSSEELHIRVMPRVCSSVQMTVQDVKYFPVTRGLWSHWWRQDAFQYKLCRFLYFQSISNKAQ